MFRAMIDELSDVARLLEPAGVRCDGGLPLAIQATAQQLRLFGSRLSLTQS